MAIVYDLDEAVRTLENTRVDKGCPHGRVEGRACVLARPVGPSHPKRGTPGRRWAMALRRQLSPVEIRVFRRAGVGKYGAPCRQSSETVCTLHNLTRP